MVNENEREILNLPYVGISSFAKYPIHLDLDTLEADVAVFGMPYDMSTQCARHQTGAPRHPGFLLPLFPGAQGFL